MSGRAESFWRRRTLVPLVVALLLGALALIFRQQLVAWFTGEPLPGAVDLSAAQKLEVGPFQVRALFVPDPPRQEGNALRLVVRDAEGRPVEDAKVAVRYRMPAMGAMQEMRGEAEVRAQGDGHYVARFDLPMGGSWELTIAIEKGERSGEAGFNLTVGTPGLTASGAGAGPSPAAHAAQPKAPSLAFDEAVRARIRAALGAYEQVRAKLARDSMQGLDAQATAIAAALASAAGMQPDLPPKVAAVFEKAGARAHSLAEARELDAARASFGELSSQLLALLAVDPRLAEGLHVFSCPMAHGFQEWFQPSPQLENPYMGQKMLTCGVPASLEASVEGEHAGHAMGEAHGAEHAAAEGDISHYTCSMHPSVRQHEPGKCPICGMELVPVTKQEAASGTVLVDEVRRQRIGVRTEKVGKRELTLEVRAVGEVRYDESRLFDVNLRMSGWVQKLVVDETGQRVKAGQTLFTLYSPELYAAQLEYLTNLGRRAGAKDDLLAPLAQASRTRLRLLGMNEAQIKALEASGKAEENVPILAPATGYVIEKEIVEGARVEAGTRVYRIADLSKVWIDAEVYESDLPKVHAGQSVEVELPYVEGKTFAGKVDYLYPTLQGQTRTGRARIVLDNKALELKPDMYANVFIGIDLGKRLAVPDSAVIYTGPRRLVFVDLGEGRLRPTPVELGVHTDGYYEVKAGLSEGEVVVTSGNFLIAAESRIRSATEYWESGDGAQ